MKDATPITVNAAIDLYIADCAREGYEQRTMNGYRRLLTDLARMLSRQALVAELRREDYERFLDRWVGMNPRTGRPFSKSTLALGVSVCKGFSRWLTERGYIESDPISGMRRPRRVPADQLDVVTIDGSEVERMLAACESEQELICVATAAYLGARRAALSTVRRGDLDLNRKTIRFREKGGKIAIKRMPEEFIELVRALDEGGMWSSPREYLIPNRRPAAMRRTGERSDKVIWLTVKRVAERAGVRSHVHALRAAFAVQFDRQHPDQIFALKELMGHSRLETTAVYLRRKDRAEAIELNADLSWGAVAASGLNPDHRNPHNHAAEAHTGFEPVSERTDGGSPLERKLAELRQRAKACRDRSAGTVRMSRGSLSAGGDPAS